MARWLTYGTIFAFSAFILHLVLEPVVTLILSVVAPGSVQSIAEPIVIVAEFGLAGAVTVLVAQFGGKYTLKRDREDERRGEALLEEERRRVDAAEQHALDEERLKRLMVEVNRWQQARDLRASVSEVLAALGDGDAATAHGVSLREELRWALAYSDRLFPLVEPQVTGTTPQEGEVGSAREGAGTTAPESPPAP